MDLEEIIASFMSLCAYLGLLSIVLTLWVLHVIQTRTSTRSYAPYKPELPSAPVTQHATVVDPPPAQTTMPPTQGRRVSFPSSLQRPKKVSVDSTSTRSSLESSVPPTPASADTLCSVWRSRTHTLADIPSANSSVVDLTPAKSSRQPTSRTPIRLPIKPFARRAATSPSTPPTPPSEGLLPLPLSLSRHRSPPPSAHTAFSDSDVEKSPRRASRALSRVIHSLKVHRRVRSDSSHKSEAATVPAPVESDYAPTSAPQSPKPHRLSLVFAHLTRRSPSSSRSNIPIPRTDPYGPEYNAPMPAPLPRRATDHREHSLSTHEQPSSPHHYHYHQQHERPSSVPPRRQATWGPSVTPSPRKAITPLPRPPHDTDHLVAAVTRKLSAHMLEERSQQHRTQPSRTALFS